MEFQEVVRRRRSVRSYDLDRPIPPEVVDRILRNIVKVPSAGFSQGWGFLVLDNAADIARYQTTVHTAEPEEAKNWFSANAKAPFMIIPCSNKDAYLDRYAQPDKGFTDRSDDWWPAPYWDIDTGMATLMSLLTAVDAGLGACLSGMPKGAIPAVRAAFGIPAQFTPIGVVTMGYSDEPPRDHRSRRKPASQVIHRGQWTA